MLIAADALCSEQFDSVYLITLLLQARQLHKVHCLLLTTTTHVSFSNLMPLCRQYSHKPTKCGMLKGYRLLVGQLEDIFVQVERLS